MLCHLQYCAHVNVNFPIQVRLFVEGLVGRVAVAQPICTLLGSTVKGVSSGENLELQIFIAT